MEYRNLGKSGVKVSSMCLGAMTFGENDEKSMMHKVGSSEDTSFAVMNRALELGINFIDTADVYGNDGLSERIIGRWFQKDKRRESVVLATKFRFRMGDGPNGTGASRYRIVRAVEASLKRLATDRIDLYQIHMQDFDTPEEETLRALDDLIHQGKVLYIGASNYAAYRLTESVLVSEMKNLNRFVALQTQYSLMVRDIERELVPACKRFTLGILPWSPLAGGFLSGKYQRNQAPPAGARLAEWKDSYAKNDKERNWQIIEALNRLSQELGVSQSQIALAWLLGKPAVTSVIFGARTTQQLEDNIKAADLKLSPKHMEVLDQASAFELGYPYDFIKRVQPSW